MIRQKEENSVARKNNKTKMNRIDGGIGWVVVGSAFMALMLVDGMLFTLGILYIEFLDEFKEGKGKTAWITSLIPGTLLTVGPITGALTNRFGCRLVCIMGALVSATGFVLSCFANSVYNLYCSLGILTGLGFGGIFLSTLVCVGQHFEKRRSFAMGISLSGSGVGIFVFAPVVRILIEEYGWRDRAEEKGMNQLDSAFLLSVIGISNTFGRILFGWIADRKGVNRLMLYGTSLVICGTANVMNPLNDSKVYLMSYASVYGMFIGVFLSLNPVILVDLLGLERLNKSLGLLMMFQGIATFLGPPLCVLTKCPSGLVKWNIQLV
ncbi:Monocarboxylate transporter 14,Monocarboxylate transporter 9 [Mytilus coruscus]|uniref:Monocarboxylate transporter 14,Monocarboxylate transporter 9 n=1 Tax=Mytilus coruscus TaxID=42192 RepID=A0A6J8CVV5_MYTCO|nr:Monocarboxylate transporter 14,Monocarboxylate transporter 9 [Mytilus coruscus]